MTNISRVLSCVALLLAAAPIGAQQAVPMTADQAPRIEGAEIKKLVDKGEAVIVDVRNKAGWDAGHVQGAVHIPLDQLAQRFQELPKDKLIAAYCSCSAEQTSTRAAFLLLQNGYKRAAAIKGGLVAWEAAGGKVVKN